MAIVISQEASSSSSKFRHSYQVFLSFRGEDTRKNFTDHLYTALVQAGIRTFRDDDEIERGKKLDLELRKAIQQSRIAIIVFSKNYASSTWCLNEVLMILEWSKLGGNEVLPIYYDVDPSEVRKQKGSIGEAFSRFEDEFIHNNEIDDEKKEEWTKKLKDWRVALEQVSNFTGMVLKNQADGREAKFIQNILNEVERKLNRANLYVDRHLVGMDYRVRNIDSWVKDSSSGVHILVICGMGGIGKTTIAKYVYNLNFHKFEGSSFLASVKEESERSNGLVRLQMQLLSSILKAKKDEIYNVDEGIIKINKAICCKRVLLVLDDVDETEKLDALLGTREFYPGSKIIITTRNKSLLNAYEFYKLHTVQTLDSNESLELFTWHAFRKEHPGDGFLEQSKRAVNNCGGLPLALKILGSSLAGKSTKVWESTLEKFEFMSDNKILNILNSSFCSLQDDHDKSLFLHISCFFVGHDKDEIIDILDACGFFTVCGIQNLVDKYLISIDENNKFMMHQLLQEMGREIVDRESLNEPWKRSRLWRPKDSFTVLKEQKGTARTEGLIFDMQLYQNDALGGRREREHSNDELCDTLLPYDQGTTFKRCYFNFLSSEPSSDVCFNYDSFSRMDNLKLLTLNYARLTGCCENFPKGLRWLCWHGFPVKSISFDLPLKNIVSLDMSYSKLEHFRIGNKDLESLKILNLSHSQRLVKTSNFRRLPNLEKLILKGCASLVHLSDTVGDLERLVLLNLDNCKSLRKFPNIGIRNKCLQSIILDGCPNIFPELLKVVDVNSAIVTPTTSTFSHHVRKWYTFFKPISRTPQQSGYCLPYLVSLSLRNCNLSDDDFPLDLSPLSALLALDLSENPLINLPPCIANLSTVLSQLSLSSCEQLHSVLDLPIVHSLDLRNCGSLERITFQSTSSKPLIYRSDCKKLIDIQDTFKILPIYKVHPKALNALGLDSAQLVRNLVPRFSYMFIRTFVDYEENIWRGLYEFGIFSTFLRREEIPSWCTNGSSSGASSSVSFVVDSHPDLKVRGLNVYFVYTLCRCITLLPYSLLGIKISNITKDLSWVYIPTVYGNPEGEEDELVWLSHWKFGSQLESGDEVHVSGFCVDVLLMVKEIGIKLVWGEEKEEGVDGNDGDLSSYQITSKGFFFLSHLSGIFIALIGKILNIFQALFGDNVTREDVVEWYSKRYCTRSFSAVQLF